LTAGAGGVAGCSPGTSPTTIDVDPASHTRGSRGAGRLGEAVGTRGGEFAVGIGEAAVRGHGEPSFIADGEADGFGKVEGRVAVAARAFTRRGELSFVTGTARDLPGRAGSVVAVASGTAAAWIRGPESGVDVGESGACAATGAASYEESSKAITKIDGQADRPIIPFPSPTRARRRVDRAATPAVPVLRIHRLIAAGRFIRDVGFSIEIPMRWPAGDVPRRGNMPASSASPRWGCRRLILQPDWRLVGPIAGRRELLRPVAPAY
jgi:hypothetical protein